MNILIPMGGKGLRFQETGLSIPKPLIDVDGDTVISRVLDSLKLQGQFIYVHRQDHAETHLIDKIINKKQKGENFYLQDDNEGQVQTCLAARELINTNEPLLIVNSDNYFVWDPASLDNLIENKEVDGAAFTFIDPHRS